MTPRATSALTLVVLNVLVISAAVVGWFSLTAPLPEQEPQPVCVQAGVDKGDKIFTDQVTVSIYNGSTQNGLANRVMTDLTDRGFNRGTSGNAPEKVKGVQIWTNTPDNPGVRLVKSHFRNASIVTNAPGAGEMGPGVVVVVSGNATLVPVNKAPESVKARGASAICTPPEVESLTE